MRECVRLTFDLEYGRGWPEPNSMTMANEALDKAIGSINFAPYDNDGNGYVRFSVLNSLRSVLISVQVDAYVVVHAGTAADESGNPNDIWSVKWVLPEEREVNGMYAGCLSEF